MQRTSEYVATLPAKPKIHVLKTGMEAVGLRRIPE